MITTHPSEPNFPIDLNEFAYLLSNDTARFSFEQIKAAGIVQHESLFHNKEIIDLSDSFSVKLELSVNSRNEIDLVVKEVILYENADEWLDAMNRIKKDRASRGII
jgi:hypothetical protein